MAVLAVEGYNEWISYHANRPRTQNSFCSFKLGDKREDVLFFHGKPCDSNESNFMSKKSWTYKNTNYSNEESETMIAFLNEKIKFIAYSSDKAYYETPEIMGFRKGSDYNKIIKKLGNPSIIETSKDGLARILYYDNWNAFFLLEKAQVTVYGVYDSTKGRPDWSAK
jgi:hypothetical protein